MFEPSLDLKFETRRKMKTKTLSSIGQNETLNEHTSSLLIRAQLGEISYSELAQHNLSSNAIKQFVARELLFLQVAANAGKMIGLSALFYDVHENLLRSCHQKDQTRPQNTD
jgi:hypothetical protein